jgi:hypothetical protein
MLSLGGGYATVMDALINHKRAGLIIQSLDKARRVQTR